MPARLRKGLAATAMRIVACVALGIAVAPARTATHPAAWFVDFHGPVLRATQLHLIYWGIDWTTTPPTADRITTAVQTMMASSFMTALHQYRAIRPASLRDATIVTDPSAPILFADHDITDLLEAEFRAGTLTRPDVANQDLYVVMTPFGTGARDGAYPGEHSYYEHSGQRVHYARITYRTTLAAATELISHEVVEAATDPEGSAVIGVDGTCHRPGWCEISDVCSTTGVIDGVAVESYWSSADGACVLPGAPPGPPRLARVHQGNGVVHLVVDEPRIRTARRREP